MIPNVLTINGGSSSIKFAIYTLEGDVNKVFSGQISKIGPHNSTFAVKDIVAGTNELTQIDARGFRESAEFLVGWLKSQPAFIQVTCIGHRIVHGMEHTHPKIIDDTLLKELYRISEYDPDHLPAEIEIIELFKKQFPALLQVASFDTSFHSGMPLVAKILPIPHRFNKEGIRRYGFHGLSYTYLIQALKKMVGTEKAKGRLILAHLGSGASIAAVKDAKSMDTSMGFTPAGGLVMGTRPGDLDPGVAWYMLKSERLTAKEWNQMINHESGLLGLSGISSDMQDLLQKETSDERVAEAVALFCYQVKKWIGAFTTVINGLDILVFAGGIGENSPIIRSRICKDFEYLGIVLDENKNYKNELVISSENSKVKVYVIPTDEEIIIAANTKELFLSNK